MNGMLIAVLAIIAGTAYIGWSRGFVRELCLLSATLITIILTAILTPKVSGFAGGDTAVTYIMLFIILSMVVRIAFRIVDLLAKAPLLNALNHIAGGLLGLVKGMIRVWLLFLLLSVFAETDTGKILIEQVQENTFLTQMYQYNLMKEVIFFLLGEL